jgi:predicted solute-binding protein
VPERYLRLHALVHGLVPGPASTRSSPTSRHSTSGAAQGTAEVTKISTAAFGRLRGQYALLRAGGVAGFGVGTIVVARSAREVGGRWRFREPNDGGLALAAAGAIRDSPDAI